MDNPKALIKRLIDQSQTILIFCHYNPDGDALGSSLAFGMVLKKLGKDVTLVCPGLIPDNLKFLPGLADVKGDFEDGKDFVIVMDASKTEVDRLKYTVEDGQLRIMITPKSGQFTAKDLSIAENKPHFDLAVMMDSSNLDMAGPFYEKHVDFFYETPVINIDHHVSNDYFGKVNLVDVTATATAEVVLGLIESLEQQAPLMDEDIATCLLTGIVTDTGSFQNANTTPKGFSVAAQLVGAGARQQEIVKHIFKTHELTTLKLWGLLLSKIQADPESRIVWSSISKKDFESTGSDESEIGGVIDELMTSAPEADVVMLLKESDGLVRGSLRAVNKSIDVAKMASLLGGGGHKQAAGFKIYDTPLVEAEAEALKTLKAALKDYPKSLEDMLVKKPNEGKMEKPVPEGKPEPKKATKK